MGGASSLPPKKRTWKAVNRTPTGEMACAFGIRFEDHYNGRGCRQCAAYADGQELFDFEEND
tara:strand:- start:826 stop:1011 length:186 start_codon:yes stop_codon:yes gene_type:complete